MLTLEQILTFRKRDELTARERVLAAFDGRETDRVPIYDLVHNIPTFEHFGGAKITGENAFEVTLRGIGRLCDMTRCIAIPTTGQRVHAVSQGFEYNFEWWTFTVTKRPYRDVDHLAEVVHREIDAIHEAVAHGRLCSEAALVAQLTAGDAQTPAEVHEVFAKMCRAVGDCVIIQPESIVGLTTAYVRAGWDLFIYLMGDYPELVHEWLEALCAYEVARIHGIADQDLSPVALVADDLAGKGGLFFSPDWLRREWFPLLKRCVDAWHAHGMKVMFHSDGNKMAIVDDLVAAGIDAINPLEPTCDMHVGDIRQRWPQLVVDSMIDCDQLIPYGSEAEVEAACKQAIDDGARGGRFFLGSSSELHPDSKLENVVKLFEVAHTYGRTDNQDNWGPPSWQ
jgi:uroporphyrinogen-III decarboxylase